MVISSTCPTAAILESASPRKPREDTVNRSSTDWILLVEWRKKASGISSFSIPQPLSVTRINEIPPSRISTVTAVAFASMAFSKSSFTTDAGRSITSPAAILLIVF